VEIVELPSHPGFVAVQFHPEFQSKPIKPHPLFASFVQAAHRHKMGTLTPVAAAASTRS
jgi:CTP synthase